MSIPGWSSVPVEVPQGSVESRFASLWTEFETAPRAAIVLEDLAGPTYGSKLQDLVRARPKPSPGLGIRLDLPPTQGSPCWVQVNNQALIAPRMTLLLGPLLGSGVSDRWGTERHS